MAGENLYGCGLTAGRGDGKKEKFRLENGIAHHRERKGKADRISRQAKPVQILTPTRLGQSRPEPGGNGKHLRLLTRAAQ